MAATTRIAFQFHTGSIRRSVIFVFDVSQIVGFNSTLVRLEVTFFAVLSAASACFNSTLVRLEGIHDVIVFCRWGNWFQFHTGSIRRKHEKYTASFPKLFQFHTGSIRSVNSDPSTLESLCKFQFHTGSIRSYCRRKTPTPADRFQFHTGSIRRF